MKDIQRDIIDKLTPEVIEDMKHIWFIADLHADHPKMVNICNRKVPLTEGLDVSIPADKMRIKTLQNDWLIRDVYNKYIDKRDEVYILGDVSMSPKIDTEKFLDKLHGNKHLMAGNHDKNILHSTRFSEITQIKNFTYSRYGINLHIVLCHYPILSWDRKIHGSWMLYGHVHGRLSVLPPILERFMGYSWDVGIDNHRAFTGLDGKAKCNLFKPTNLYDVVEIMNWKSKTITIGIDGEYADELE